MSSFSFFFFFLLESAINNESGHNTRRKKVSILSSRKAKNCIEANLHSVCRTSATGSWRGLVHPRGYFRSAYVVHTSKVFHAGGQSMPEGIRVIVSRPSGKKRIQGVKRKVDSPRYGPQDASVIASGIPSIFLSSFKLWIDSSSRSTSTRILIDRRQRESNVFQGFLCIGRCLNRKLSGRGAKDEYKMKNIRARNEYLVNWEE